jgi:quercetin dioxygenase-like cupin family protein
MTTTTFKSCKKNLGSPDIVRDVPYGRLEFVNVHDMPLTRITLQPGWQWSEHVQPSVHTESCQAQHAQYVIRGRLRLRTDEGEEFDLSPGDFAVIAPGHDAWVVGNEPFVCVDMSPEMKAYAEGA